MEVTDALGVPEGPFANVSVQCLEVDMRFLIDGGTTLCFC